MGKEVISLTAAHHCFTSTVERKVFVAKGLSLSLATNTFLSTVLSYIFFERIYNPGISRLTPRTHSIYSSRSFLTGKQIYGGTS